MFDILCYGDSNTWGFNPEDGSRFPKEIRWTGVAEAIIGPKYNIIENGINGRTTVFDSPYGEDYQNGFKGLKYALNASKPLDGVVIMLGTNDLNYTDAEGSYKGLYRILNLLKNAYTFFKDTTKGSSSPIWKESPNILLVSPIRRNRKGEEYPNVEEERNKQSLLFPLYTKKLSTEFKTYYLDASSIVFPSTIDGLHMDEENHKKLGIAIAEKLKEIFE